MRSALPAYPALIALAAALACVSPSAQAATTLAPAGGGVAAPQLIGPGPTAYLRFQDSPFFGLPFTNFTLKDWENGVLEVPGVQVEATAYSLSSGFGPSLIDSVDADDGLINGASHNGADHYGNAVWSGDGFRFTFSRDAQGAYPTHAGIVWTDGGNYIVRFEAFDAHGISLGTVEGDHYSENIGNTGDSTEDRLYGAIYAGGISAIRIWHPEGGAVEVDHLQFGRGPVAPGGAPFAYAANAGWLNARTSTNDGLRINPASLAGWAYGANLGWVHFGDGPVSPSTSYANTSAATFGVNRDPAGNLTGYAYSANTGWINFGWASATDPQRARTDLASGRFLGYAYSANLGWIDLAAAGLAHDIVTFLDTDLDSLPDSWEYAYFGTLAAASAISDYDGDGVTDLAEYQTGTNPRDLDSPAPASPSTIATDAGHLYAANAGWIDARPSSRFGLKVGEYFLSGWLSAPNFGWIHVGDGTPTNGHAYTNSPGSPADYGVNLDATGALSGHAYGANIGWINFGWAEPNDPNRPRVDLTSGLFTGYAYSANLGWIALDSGALRTTSLDRPDTDADSMDDAWERENFGTIATAGVGTDADGDGQTDAAEYIAGTDPQDNADRFRIISQTFANQITDVTLEFTSSDTIYILL